MWVMLSRNENIPDLQLLSWMLCRRDQRKICEFGQGHSKRVNSVNLIVPDRLSKVNDD